MPKLKGSLSLEMLKSCGWQGLGCRMLENTRSQLDLQLSGYSQLVILIVWPRPGYFRCFCVSLFPGQCLQSGECLLKTLLARFLSVRSSWLAPSLSSDTCRTFRTFPLCTEFRMGRFRQVLGNSLVEAVSECDRTAIGQVFPRGLPWSLFHCFHCFYRC